MRILYVTAGAAGMYCGSCLLDNALASELLARKHDVVLLPLYTPTLTDEANVSTPRVFFGGVSVYLEQHLALFRKTPRLLDKLWDSPWLLKKVSGRAVTPNPRLLGELTVSMLKGEEGFQRKEMSKMLDWLRLEQSFDIVHLPNSLLIALAKPLRRTLKRPVCVTLQGEDLFLEGLQQPYRDQALELIREQVSQVDAFIVHSTSYASFMQNLLGIPSDKMHVIQLGINPADFEPASRLRSSPIRIGYLARIAPEKGLHLLCDAYCKLRADKSLPETQLEVAGYLAPEHRTYLRDAKATLYSHGIGAEFHFHGTLDRKAKLQFLRGLDIFSVPVTYDDPKGLPVLEAMAAGIPVVQPRLGAFAEILETTGGGLLVQPHDANSLADGLKKLVRDGPLSSQLGSLGRKGVLNYFNVSRMVNQTLTLYQDLGIRATRPVPISL